MIRPLVSPPLPTILVDPLFAAFDENQDGHIDFKELSCGVSAACRGPEAERQKCKKPSVASAAVKSPATHLTDLMGHLLLSGQGPVSNRKDVVS